MVGSDTALRIDSANTADLERLHPWFDAEARALPGSVQHSMRVALEEAVMNAAMHAFPSHGSGEITVRLCVSPATAALIVEDTGRLFDPTAEPARARQTNILDAEPGGLGLTLLRHYCRDIRYERANERNRLTMRFPLPAA